MISRLFFEADLVLMTRYVSIPHFGISTAIRARDPKLNCDFLLTRNIKIIKRDFNSLKYPPQHAKRNYHPRLRLPV